MGSVPGPHPKPLVHWVLFPVIFTFAEDVWLIVNVPPFPEVVPTPLKL
jgi:hypothetical protein